MRRRSLVLLWLGLALCAAAQQGGGLPEEVHLSIGSFPPSEVFLETPTGVSFLGKSGPDRKIAPPLMRDSKGKVTQYARGELVYRAPGHQDFRVTVTGQQWGAGQLPEVALVPNSFAIRVKDYVQVYPLASLGVLTLAIWGAAMAVRWRTVARTTTAEVRVLSSQLDTAGDPLVGKLMGRYRVEARLGQGGMGSVYRVSDDVGTYAAKVIYFETLDSQSVDRFRREFKLLSQLQHSTFPRCFDYQEKDGMAFQVMELVSGQTLRQSMRPSGLPWTTVRPWILDMLDGLECAHQQGIVHRDLKPENIMVNGSQVRILDFGIARQAQVTAITITGQAFGTPQYIAPEQVYGSSTEIDARTDLYSLGIIIYELLAGHPPFQAEDVQELVSMHLSSPVPPLAPELGLPEGVAGVVDVLLAKNPANRYSSAKRVKEILEGVGSGPATLGTTLDQSGTINIPKRRPPQL